MTLHTPARDVLSTLPEGEGATATKPYTELFNHTPSRTLEFDMVTRPLLLRDVSAYIPALAEYPASAASTANRSASLFSSSCKAFITLFQSAPLVSRG